MTFSPTSTENPIDLRNDAPREALDERALDDALIRALDRTLPRYARLLRHAIAEAEEADRLTLPQLRALQTIAAPGGPVALTTHVARALGVAPPTMTAMVDGLAERGLVERRPDPANRRQIQLLLTPEGETVLARHQAVIDARLRTAIDRLTLDQRERLLAAVADLAAGLDAVGAPGGPEQEG